MESKIDQLIRENNDFKRQIEGSVSSIRSDVSTYGNKFNKQDRDISGISQSISQLANSVKSMASRFR